MTERCISLIFPNIFVWYKKRTTKPVKKQKRSYPEQVKKKKATKDEFLDSLDEVIPCDLQRSDEGECDGKIRTKKKKEDTQQTSEKM